MAVLASPDVGIRGRALLISRVAKLYAVTFNPRVLCRTLLFFQDRVLPRAAKADNETTGQLTTGPVEGREQRTKKTPNAQRRTSNVQLRQEFEQKETKIQKSVSVGHRNQHARRVCYPSTLNSHLSRRSFNEGGTIN
jgi:hypothetical protein